MRLNGENEILEWQPGSNLKLMINKMINISKPDQLIIVNDDWCQDSQKERFKKSSEDVVSNFKENVKEHKRHIKDYEFKKYDEDEDIEVKEIKKDNDINIDNEKIYHTKNGNNNIV